MRGGGRERLTVRLREINKWRCYFLLKSVSFQNSRYLGRFISSGQLRLHILIPGW